MIVAQSDARALDSAGQQFSSEQLAQIVATMRGPAGVALSDNRYRFRRYRGSFVGSQAVDWLVARYGLTRAQAVRMGERLHAHRLIEHVVNEHDFVDGYYFYRFAASAPIELPGDREASALSDAQLRSLVQAMRAAGGPRVGTHYHRLVRYPDCFNGRDAVTWLTVKMAIDRPYASAIGRRMLRRDLIRHVFDEHDFFDRRLFYRFV